MVFIFSVLGILAIVILAYALTHPVRAIVSIAKYLCIGIGLILLFFTLTVGTQMGVAWMIVGISLIVGSFFGANRLSALQRNL